MRLDVIDMLVKAHSGHAAGPLSAADIFAFLYNEYLNHDPANPDSKERDYFLVSNGHIAPIWYSALARSGYFSVKELETFREFGSMLQGHPWNLTTPGVFNSSGLLGHGVGQAIGVAIGLKLDKKSNQVICYTSDGEHQEGMVWEAIMSAPKFKLDNLTFVLDRNRIQIDGTTQEIMPLDNPLTERDEVIDKYLSFQWDVITIDGHNFDDIREAFNSKRRKGKPRLILANTIAGKGVIEMENNPKYHDWRNEDDVAASGRSQLEAKLKELDT